MSIDKTLKHHSSLSSANNPEAQRWLDKALESKKDLIFNKNLSQKDFDPNSPINLSRFGFRNPNDIKVFLLSPAGDTVKAKISEKIALDKAIEERNKFERYEEEKSKSRLKAYLLLWLIEKKGHAAARLRELIEEQNTNAINQSKALAQSTSPASSPANKGLQDTINQYNNVIKEHQAQYQKLEKEETRLTELFENLQKQQVAIENKHAIYMEKLNQFDSELTQYEQMSPEALDAKITALEAAIERSVEETINGEELSDEKLAQLVVQQNALGLELENLLDLRAEQKKEKAFYNTEGEKTASLKDAAFITHSKQKIVKKDGIHYLVNKTENLDDLTPAQRQKAALDFEKSKSEIMAIPKLVVDTCNKEKEFHNQRIDEVSKKTEETRNEKMNLENQINLLDSVRASLIQQSLELNPNNTPKPMPTVSGKAQSSSLSPQFSSKLTPFIKSPDLSNQLLKEIDDDKNLKSKDKKNMKDFFTTLVRSLGLGTIPSLAPLPPTTMQSLLEHMARFGADATKPGLTSIQNPLDLRNDAQKRNNVQQAPSSTNQKNSTLSSQPQTPQPEKVAEEKPPRTFNPMPTTPSPYKN